jgi:DNA-binding LacI/PurR family transcriptional regulator
VLRQRVAKAAQRLGYTPTAFARGLHVRATGLVGIIMESLVDPVQAALLQVLLEVLGGSGRWPTRRGPSHSRAGQRASTVHA